jgi:hypothetical protein
MQKIEADVMLTRKQRTSGGGTVIAIGDIYDKNINFLIGSGASHGLLPTLELGAKKADGRNWSIEELATHFDESKDNRYVPLFMHYYASCIRPAQLLDVSSVQGDVQKSVIANYRSFLETILHILHRRQRFDRRCNLFTTNYDGCFPLVADEILRDGFHHFVLNDGSRGFRRKILHARHFNSYLYETGVFERHQTSVPQINLIHLHGSVYWKRVFESIQVTYDHQPDENLIDDVASETLKPFSDALGVSSLDIECLPHPEFDSAYLEAFWSKYKTIPVVNPTKWKFHETVYEEHYYQMLRLLSYELEKPNAVLITFGFSFGDEHILNLVKRSLSNPHLQVFVCCYDTICYQKLADEFRQYRNVKCLALEGGELMHFAAFNSKVLTIQLTETAKENAIASKATASPGDIESGPGGIA